ncbi:MAG: T9SS type A sorting domain-containing protein [Bacteroidetes bacterium]|nr:T9SS type A sorting domain-containing protein [Bacteroidota bacterium]
MKTTISHFRIVLFALGFLAFSSLTYSQISSPGTPLSILRNLERNNIEQKIMPGFDMEEVKRQDKIESAMKDIPFRFGYGYSVNIGLTNAGTWNTLADGSKVWRVEITSAGAFGLNFIYNKFYMPKGCKFFVYSQDRTMILGAFDENNNIPERMFSTAPVKGETVVLELNVPAGVSETPELNVSSVVHEYKDIFRFMKAFTDDFGTSGSCEINVNCPLGDPWKKQSRSVAMVLLSDGTRWCSGSLLNNTRNDGTPFFMSANHCLSGSTTTWIFMFKYESPNCSIIDGPTNFTITGATLLANNAASDFALMKLSSKPPSSYNVYYAGWNRADVGATSGAGIHHPDGDIKKISFSLVPYTSDTWSGTPANSHWKVNWSAINGNTAVTEGGSSGSPMYDQNQRFIGQLHGGPSACGASQLWDFYGKFSMSWDYGSTSSTRVKDWLDSANTGVTVLDGYDPFGTALSAFNLQTPTAGARIVTIGGSNVPVTITWDTASQGINYRFIFGNVVTPRRISISASSNSITTTLGALDAMLASAGFTNNGTASDSLVGQWDIWAYKNPGSPGADSIKSTNGPRAITFRRQQTTISAFNLVSPATGFRIVTNPIDPTPINIIWNKSGNGGAAYKWLFKTGASYSDPATIRLTSNNLGYDTVLSFRTSQADSLLASFGLAPGDSVVGYWRVRAYATDSINSTGPDRQITLRRASLLPLYQDFTDAAFPPAFWTLTGTGTQYWTRATVSGYGHGTASAKYDFWTATATTGSQTLVSNQFPPVTAGSNYLRFNYAAAYYSATAIDSCVVETSTDNGTTWTRLIGMYQSTSLSSGVNSSSIMSTVSSTSSFTPTNTQWATKVYTMPIGTNKVRFNAKSAYGNNLYIDDIIAGVATGIGGTPLTLTPDKYEISQNYPNPFNPTTKINFSLPKQGFVTLKVYDVLGKMVAKLVSEVKPAGVYSVDFNANTLASGIYFYRIESLDFVETKRMMLIK